VGRLVYDMKHRLFFHLNTFDILCVWIDWDAYVVALYSNDRTLYPLIFGLVYFDIRGVVI
jgi:hypothetical protein